MILMLPYYFTPAPEKQLAFSMALTDLPGTLLQMNLGITVLINLAYLVLVARGTRIFWNWQTLRDEPLVRNLLKIILWTALVLGIAAFGIVGHRFSLVYLALALATLGHLYIFAQMHRNPQTFFSLRNIAERARYRRALPKEIDTRDLRIQLENLIEDRKLHHDPDLSLAGMAQILSITPHQLSQFLNEHVGKNFAGFLNEFRVAEAKTKLLDEQNLSATAIGYQLGFSNYATFQLVFRKAVGISPKAYREKLRRN